MNGVELSKWTNGPKNGPMNGPMDQRMDTAPTYPATQAGEHREGGAAEVRSHATRGERRRRRREPGQVAGGIVGRSEADPGQLRAESRQGGGTRSLTHSLTPHFTEASPLSRLYCIKPLTANR